MLTSSLSLHLLFLHVQWHTSRWKSGDSVDLTNSDVVSTFGQVPGGQITCFCNNGALTQKWKPICNLSDCDNQQTAMYRPRI